jgi:hypothetical protein
VDIGEILADLSGCIETTFTADGRPGVCFNGIVPGDGMAADWAGDCGDGPCGMTWVRAGLVYPSATIGVQDQTAGNCGTGLGVDIEVGVLRCTHVGLPDNPEVEEGEALEVSLTLIDDMLSLRRAIICCSALPAKEYILGAWNPMGPLGGLTGGAWTVYVGAL